MKKYFKIIMQLHAEEGGAPAPAATTEPAPAVVPATEPAPVTTQEPAPAAQQPSSTEPAATPSPDYKVVAEEGGLQVVVGADGRRHLIDKSLEPEPKQNTETEPAPVPGTGTEPQSQQAKPASEVESAPVHNSCSTGTITGIYAGRNEPRNPDGHCRRKQNPARICCTVWTV